MNTLDRCDGQHFRGKYIAGDQDKKDLDREFDKIVKNVIFLFKRWLKEKHKNGNSTSATLRSDIQRNKKSKNILFKITQHSDLATAF